jgi:hypothetical protein
MAKALDDLRDPSRVIHDLGALPRQRISYIAMGYEDTNDSTTLRTDPALKAALGGLPETAVDLASKPMLCRSENRVSRRDLRRLADRLFSLYPETHLGRRDVIVVDIDATDDPTHGHQQLSSFQGYYEEHMYHSLLVFDGLTGFRLPCVLGPGNTDGSHGSVAVLNRIIKTLKRAYRGAQIVVRADAGFAVPSL